MSKTIEMIKNYIPNNEQEEKDKQFFIDCEKQNQILTRDNELCHLSSSAIILNKSHDKVLCIFHNIYNSWAWVGGHADGDDDMEYVALKEAKEETSLQNIKPLLGHPVSIESLPVLGHFKRGKFVSAHIHLNVTYLLEADENEPTHIKKDENSGVAWLKFDELLEKSTEPYMVNVYKKIFDRVQILKQEGVL